MAELRGICTAVFLSGGSVVLSDAVRELEGERRGMLDAMLPVAQSEGSMIVHDLLSCRSDAPELLSRDMGSRRLVALCNWGERPAVKSIDIEAVCAEDGGVIGYHCYEWWSREYRFLAGGSLACDVEPHSAAMWAVRPARKGDRWCVVGSDLHMGILPEGGGSGQIVTLKFGGRECCGSVVVWLADADREILVVTEGWAVEGGPLEVVSRGVAAGDGRLGHLRVNVLAAGKGDVGFEICEDLRGIR